MHQLLYITCANHDEALNIANRLLEKRLIACANILPPIISCFRWQAQTQQSEEVILIAKSVKDRFSAIESEVTALHSYDCPCILAFDTAVGHAPFLRWIEEETAENSS